MADINLEIIRETIILIYFVPILKSKYLNYFFPLNFPNCDTHNFRRLIVNYFFSSVTKANKNRIDDKMRNL